MCVCVCECVCVCVYTGKNSSLNFYLLKFFIEVFFKVSGCNQFILATFK